MGGTFREQNVVQRRKRISKARKKTIKKQRAEKVAMSTRILTNETDDMPPLNPREKVGPEPIVEDGEFIIPPEDTAPPSRCVIS